MCVLEENWSWNGSSGTKILGMKTHWIISCSTHENMKKKNHNIQYRIHNELKHVESTAPNLKLIIKIEIM